MMFEVLSIQAAKLNKSLRYLLLLFVNSFTATTADVVAAAVSAVTAFTAASVKQWEERQKDQGP